MRMKKKFSASSKRWIQRQLKDHYVLKAREENYRCRSAYKLLEIQTKYKIMQPGMTVLDLGCCPGSWTQVAVESTKSVNKDSNSLVIGIDLQEVEEIQGAKIYGELDFLHERTQRKLIKKFKERPVDVLLSDMAPNTTGNRFVDHVAVSRLCFQTLGLVQKLCGKGASLVMKVFDGEDCQQLMKYTRYLFDVVRVVRPKATRQPSSEMFYLGLCYKGNTLPEEEEYAI